MKKLFNVLLVLSIFAGVGCGKTEDDGKQAGKGADQALENTKQMGKSAEEAVPVQDDAKQAKESIELDPKVAKQVREEAQQALEAAMAAQKQADALEGGWRSTDKLIKGAKGALSKDDGAKALKLSKKAKVEAELAYKQAKHEKDHWSPPPYAR